MNILKSKKGITGSDVAAAITVIVLTVGRVTSIYINTLNKSKDNLRYANAVRIATNIMENIQKNSFEYLIGTCTESGNKKTINSINSNGEDKPFGTKVPKGFEATVTATPVSGASYDIARDVIVTVKYRASMSYKTITLRSVKEKELMDMTNPPDLSLVPGYNESGNYVYPVKKVGTNYQITTTTDMDWYNYANGKYANVCVTSSVLNVGVDATGSIYYWIPRYVVKPGTGLDGVQFLYGTSKLPITLNRYPNNSGNLFSYGITSTTKETTNSYYPGAFTDNDGKSGMWYGTGCSAEANNAYTGLNSKIPKTN